LAKEKNLLRGRCPPGKPSIGKIQSQGGGLSEGLCPEVNIARGLGKGDSLGEVPLGETGKKVKGILGNDVGRSDYLVSERVC